MALLFCYSIVLGMCILHRHLLGLCNYSWLAQLGVERTAHGWPDCANTHSDMISIIQRFRSTKTPTSSHQKIREHYLKPEAHFQYIRPIY